MLKVDWTDILGIKQHVGFALTFEQKYVYDFVPKIPLICVLGHVDHGKTSLIDCISNENIASWEIGSITQSLRTKTFKHKGIKLIFIDTPGHLLFNKVRFDCLRISDIAILVISHQEGLKSQTIESINMIKQLKLPIIIVYSKLDCDLLGREVNILRIRSELSEINIKDKLIDKEIIEVQVSTKSNENIKHLLDILCSMISKLRLKEINISSPFIGIVLDINTFKVHQTTVNVLIYQGVLKQGQGVMSEHQMFNVYFKENIGFVVAIDVVELTGLPINIIPGQYIKSLQHNTTKIKQYNVNYNNYLKDFSNKRTNVIIKANSFSSLNGIISLANELWLKIIWTGIGHVSLTNIKLALATKSILIAFNVKASTDVKTLAQRLNIILLNSALIYELAQWLRDLITQQHAIQIIAQVEKVFSYKQEILYGAKLIYGKIYINQRLVVIRQEQLLFTVQIKTLKHYHLDIKQFNEVNQLFGFSVHEKKDLKLNDKLALEFSD